MMSSKGVPVASGEPLRQPLLSKSINASIAESNAEWSDFVVEASSGPGGPERELPPIVEAVEAQPGELRLQHMVAPAEDALLTWIRRAGNDHSTLIGGTVIQTGSFGLTLRNGVVGVVGSGRRRIWDPQCTLARVEQISNPLIQLKDNTIVRILPGEIGLAVNAQGAPVVLDEGRHVLRPPEWSFVGKAKSTDDIIKWSSYSAVVLVRVRPGNVAFITEDGAPRMLHSRTELYELQAPRTQFIRIESLLGSDALRFDQQGSLDVIRVRPGNIALAWHLGSPHVLTASEQLYELRSPEWQFVKLADVMQEHIWMDDKASLDVVRVRPGKLGLFWEGGRPRVLLARSESYQLKKPQQQFMKLVDATDEHIWLGSLHIITISSGRRGVVWVKGEAKIIEEGRIVFDEDNFEFGGSVEVSTKKYSLGPFCFVTVSAGEVGIKYTCGRLEVLEPGMHQLSSGNGEVFNGFFSTQTRVMKLGPLPLTTLDNVDLMVDAVLTWGVSHAERAIRDVCNLEEVLRQRTETTLATIFSHTNYSEKAPPPPVHAAGSIVPRTELAANLATTAREDRTERALSTQVHREFMNSIERTAADDWGVSIGDLSVDNIKIVNATLASDLERRAVIAVQTDTKRANAENEKEVNLIEADALSQKRTLEARADTAKTVADAEAQAKVVRSQAEAQADAARILAEANAQSLRIMSQAEAEARVTKAKAEKVAVELEAEGTALLGANALSMRQWEVQARMVQAMFEHQRTFVDTQQMPTMAQLLNMNALSQLGTAAFAAGATPPSMAAPGSARPAGPAVAAAPTHKGAPKKE